MKQLFYTVLFLGMLWHRNTFAQTTFNSASNSATINGMTFEYTIGEMAIVSTEKSNQLIITQGFLQPGFVGQSENNNPKSELLDFASIIKIYPNPTTNVLFFESDFAFDKSFDFQVFDASGKIIFNKKEATTINANKFSVNLNSYPTGVYFLMLSQNDQQGKLQNISFKIQKTN